METKRFIGNDMARLYERVRREYGPEAVILRTRSLLRDGAEPLIELIAAPPHADREMSLDLQWQMIDGALGHLQISRPRMTIGELEDLAVREETEQFQLSQPNLPAPAAAPAPPAPEWLQGFVGQAPGRPARGQTVEGAVTRPSRPPLPSEAEPPLPFAPRRRPTIDDSRRASPQLGSASPNPVEADVAAALVSHGLTPAAAQIVAAASGETDPRLALAHALSARDVRYPDEHETALIAMLGPVGSGRTTALLRMALDCADAGREALLIAADTTHVAAREQVHAYAEAIGIPVVDAYDQQEFVREVTRARRGTCIFADVPAGEWRSPAFAGVTQLSYLALPSHWQRATVEQLLAPQATAGCAGAVLTFTDLATQLSPILSVLIESRLGVAFLSSGRDVATGIEVADPLTLASGVFATRTGGTTNGRFAASA